MTRLHTPLSRRRFLQAAGTGLALAAFAPPDLLRADDTGISEAYRTAIASSPLVYVSPLKKGGAESTCHGEVWFVADGDDLLVVTDVTRWKAQAIEKGLDRARLWVGDHGLWKDSGGAFKSSPQLDAGARIDTDSHQKALEKFGAKYPEAWGKWGPRFKSGLADKSRVLIRYSAG